MSQFELITFEEYAGKQHSPVYVFEIEFGNKKITYFGVEHSNDPEKPMFREIENKFKEVNPQMVFIEGMYFKEGQKQQLAEEMKKMDSETVIKEWGESGFTFKLAAETKVEVESPEPNFKEEVENLVNLGFTKEEIFAYYGYRQANSYQRMPEKPSIEEYLGSYIGHFKNDTRWEGFDYSIEHLKLIGKEIWGARGDIEKEDFWRTDPVPYKDKKLALSNNVNRISQQSSYFRDRFMIQKIKETMEKYDRLFIVFGSSHAFMQESILRKLFE